MTLTLILLLTGCGKPTAPKPEATGKPSVSESVEARPASAQQDTVWDDFPEPDWGDLPEISARPELPDPVPPADRPSSSDAAMPGADPLLPNAIWQTGQLNGKPASGMSPDPEAPLQFSPNERVLRISADASLPERLVPGATLIVDIPGFPEGLYTVGAAILGGTYPDGPPPKAFHELRKLEMRWNDRLLWSRWVNAGHSLERAVVPPDSVGRKENRITLINAGEEPLYLDALWVEPLQKGAHPFYVAAENAESLNRRDSAWVRTVSVELPLPRTRFEPEAFPPLQGGAPPTVPSELEAAWRESVRKFERLKSADPYAARELEIWHRRLGMAVARGMMPAVRVVNPQPGGPAPCLGAAVYVYGNLFHSWVLPRNSAGFAAEETLRSLYPDTEVMVYFHPRETDRTVLLGRLPTHYNHHLYRDVNHRQAFLAGELDADGLASTRDIVLSLRSSFHGYIERQTPYASRSVHAMLAEHLMTYDRAAMLHDSFPGGPMFPAGDDTPGLMWHYLRNTFRFGGPAYRKSLANLTPEGRNPEIGQAFWAVADNGRDSVQVLVHTPMWIRGAEARLALPVPWAGPTDLLFHRVVFDPREGTMPETHLVRQTLNARPFGESSADPDGGWIEFTFPMHTHHLMELRPSGSRAARHNFAPERTGFSELQTTNSLFDISTQAPPPWWSRKRLAVHSFTRWRVSGNVEINFDSPASRGGTPDWSPLLGLHPPLPATLDQDSPLDVTSTRFRFGAPGDEPLARVVRGQWPMHLLRRGERLGIWLRVNPPPDDRPAHPWAIGPRRTRIYMGTLPYRQLMELELNRWYFISSPVDAWRGSTSRHERHLMFWPANPLDGEPEIEVNSIDVYQVGSDRNQPPPGRSLGFVNSDESGHLQVLILGTPGKPAFWRQRLPYRVEPDAFRHVIDPGMLTTADSPEDDPPEKVRYALELNESAHLMEIHIETMPAAPSEIQIRRIQRHFPAMAHAIRRHGAGAVLLDSTPTEARE